MSKAQNDFLELVKRDPNAARMAVIRAVSERSLVKFVRYFWPTVEPARQFIPGWHIDAICEHLQAVSDGDIKRLLINVPPGFAKSMICNVFWPAWQWAKHPPSRFLAFSYSQTLTVRDNIRFRQVIMSDLYRMLWGNAYGPSEDQFSMIKVANNKTGFKLASSVKGVGTGERADFLLLDDPNSVKEAESQVVRESTNQWFREVIPTRLNSPEHSSIVVIQQRTHEEDISGIILSNDLGYEHLCIPMKFDTARTRLYSSIGWVDPRTEEGELAWPKQFPAHVVRKLEKDIGTYAASGQLQQMPSPRGGGIIKNAHWQLFPYSYAEEFDENEKPLTPLEYPAMEFIIASLDTAYGEKEENDFCALTVWGVWRKELPRIAGGEPDLLGAPKVMLMAAWKERLPLNGTLPEREPGETDWEYRERSRKCWGLIERVHDTCKQMRVDRLLIENKTRGQDVANELMRVFADLDYGVELLTPKGDKTSRAYAVQHIFENKNVYAPNRSWAQMVIDDTASFPKGAHDDIPDTVFQAIKYLRDNNYALLSTEHEEDIAIIRTPKGKLEPLYNV